MMRPLALSSIVQRWCCDPSGRAFAAMTGKNLHLENLDTRQPEKQSHIQSKKRVTIKNGVFSNINVKDRLNIVLTNARQR